MAITSTTTNTASNSSSRTATYGECDTVSCTSGNASTTSTLGRASKSKRSKLARMPFLSRTRKMWSSARSMSSSSRSPTSDAARGSDSSASVRKVRFSKVVSVKKILSVSSMTPQEKAEVWLTASEREQIKTSARAQASGARCRRPWFEAVLNDAFNNALFLAATTDFESLLQDTGIVEKKARGLLKWTCRRNDSFRGLEDSFSGLHRYSRHELAAEARQMVTMARFRKGFADDGEISQQYKDMAKASTVLARLLAHADECAARRVYSDSMEPKLPTGAGKFS